jgi:hypothetical protein
LVYRKAGIYDIALANLLFPGSGSGFLWLDAFVITHDDTQMSAKVKLDRLRSLDAEILALELREVERGLDCGCRRRLQMLCVEGLKNRFFQEVEAVATRRRSMEMPIEVQNGKKTISRFGLRVLTRVQERGSLCAKAIDLRGAAPLPIARTVKSRKQPRDQILSVLACQRRRG